MQQKPSEHQLSWQLEVLSAKPPSGWCTGVQRVLRVGGVSLNPAPISADGTGPEHRERTAAIGPPSKLCLSHRSWPWKEILPAWHMRTSTSQSHWLGPGLDSTTFPRIGPITSSFGAQLSFPITRLLRLQRASSGLGDCTRHQPQCLGRSRCPASGSCCFYPVLSALPRSSHTIGPFSHLRGAVSHKAQRLGGRVRWPGLGV